MSKNTNSIQKSFKVIMSKFIYEKKEVRIFFQEILESRNSGYSIYNSISSPPINWSVSTS